MNEITNTADYALSRLFKVVSKTSLGFGKGNQKKWHSPSNQVGHGFICVTPDYCPVSIPDHVFEAVNAAYGISADEINATFYKSFDTVEHKNRIQLWIDQVLHYLSTYGNVLMGEEPMAYIPSQAVNIPDVNTDNLEVTIIRVMDDDTITGIVSNYLRTTKQLSHEFLTLFKGLMNYINIKIEDIASFEGQVYVYKILNRVPSEPVTLLRYLVYSTCGETMLIKNDDTIDLIKNFNANSTIAYDILSMANLSYMASIFYRYKPIFLAYKRHKKCAPIINRIRRLANTYHRAASPINIKNYIPLVLEGKTREVAYLNESMDNFTAIKLMNAILQRLDAVDGDPVAYNIRNGRVFCKANATKELKYNQYDILLNELDKLLTLVSDRIAEKVAGKTLYIPEYIRYAAPTSGKQFVGHFPWGTYITPVTEDDALTIGVQWKNNGEMTDLDLHAFSPTRHFGWNGEYNGNNVIFSGDMTDAPEPHGAAEAYWLNNPEEPIIFSLNEFNGPAEVPFKVFFSSEAPEARKRNYIVNPNCLLVPPIPMTIRDYKGFNLGFYDDGKFVLYSGTISEGHVPHGNYKDFIQAVVTQWGFRVMIDDILISAGANIIRTEEEIEDIKEDFIDLSPNAVTASTFMNLFS